MIFCRLTNILPIDVVYTWVNGSDPILIEGLKKIEQNNSKCPLSHCVPAPYIAMEYVPFFIFIEFMLLQPNQGEHTRGISVGNLSHIQY